MGHINKNDKVGITSGKPKLQQILRRLGLLVLNKQIRTYNGNSRLNLDTMQSNVSTNNDKVGITTAQADEITANTAKKTFPGMGDIYS